MTINIRDAETTLRIFTRALEATPEIDTTTWDKFNLINATFDYQGFHISAYVHKHEEIMRVQATVTDTQRDITLLNITSFPDFVLESIKLAAARYPLEVSA